MRFNLFDSKLQKLTLSLMKHSTTEIILVKYNQNLNVIIFNSKIRDGIYKNCQKVEPEV